MMLDMTCVRCGKTLHTGDRYDQLLDETGNQVCGSLADGKFETYHTVD